MTSRLPWDEFGMQLALLARGQCYDPKVQVGACILDANHRVVSLGFNGRAPGANHERESYEQGKSGFLHAEENAIFDALVRGQPSMGHTLYTTSEPCDLCAGRIIRVAPLINRVVYLHPYKDAWRMENGLPSGATILAENQRFKIVVERLYDPKV